MLNIINEISQIVFYLKDSEEIENRLCEVALFDPLASKKDKKNKETESFARSLSVLKQFPLLRRFALRIQIFFFKHCQCFVKKERKSPESRFKTVLALLLIQEEMRNFFLNPEKKRGEFLKILMHVAHECGSLHFSLPPSKRISSLQLARELTWLDGIGGSLIDDPSELMLQLSLLNRWEQNNTLFKLLNYVKRSPVTSVLEVDQNQKNQEIVLTTHFGKYCIDSIEKKTGKVKCVSTIDQTKVGPLKTENTLNQRIAVARDRVIGSYCGELTSRKNVLEQILFLLDHQNMDSPQDAQLLHDLPQDQKVTEMEILFSSLFTWKEMEKITRQYYAIRSLNGVVLKRGEKFYRLNLYFFNIPFFRKFPTPAETHAILEDLNEESLILLTFKTMNHLLKKTQNEKLSLFLKSIKPNLTAIAEIIHRLREPFISAVDDQMDIFLKSKTKMIDQIDLFRYRKKQWIPILFQLLNSEKLAAEEKELLYPLLFLLGSKGKGIEKRIMLGTLADQLGILQNTNCTTSNVRTETVAAADKAQFAYSSILKLSFLPGVSSSRELDLYKILYTLYYSSENPKITLELGIKDGLLNPLFLQNLKKHPEAEKYLIPHIPQIFAKRRGSI
ncbi:MAG: hypothetical protein KDK55_06700 [Chlamydiia bacterium]|nr:hypothetical protein [Chlamydiia bacterium]